jgi:hypothetical protein
MEILVGGKSPESKKERLQKIFLTLADKIGDKIYDRKPIKKDDVVSFLKRKKEQIAPRKKKTVNIFELIKNLFKKKEKTEKVKTIRDKRKIGMIVLTGIILIIVVIFIYTISIIVDWLLSIMEWWVLFALFVIITTPAILAIAFYMATQSNDEVYNLK